MIEQNRDAQMRTLLAIEQEKLLPVLHYNGSPITAKNITDKVNHFFEENNIKATQENK